MLHFNMRRIIHHKAPGYIVEKLCKLAEHLAAQKGRYDYYAHCTPDYRIADTLRLLSQENLQYINEIYSQLRISGAGSDDGETICTKPELSPSFVEDIMEKVYSTEEILTACCAAEKQTIAAFRNILNEPFLMQDTRMLLRHQLNGTMYAFLQLKLLRNTFSYKNI